VLRVRDHVAHVEVVRQDAGLALQPEAQVEQVAGGGVHAAHQHALVADVRTPTSSSIRAARGDQRGE
jgi:hypothetical protein